MDNITRVLVVDDNGLMRRGLSETISVEPGLEVVGAAANAAQARELYRELRPDVVTMDYQMPGENGIQCTRKLVDEFPDARIILLSVCDAEEDIWRAVQAGVKGYLSKKTGEVDIVIDAITSVAMGETYFPAAIARKLERRKGQQDLTPRELQIIKLLANGNSNKDICSELDIALPTVKLHILNIRGKLDAVDRTEAVVKAFRRGILRLEE